MYTLGYRKEGTSAYINTLIISPIKTTEQSLSQVVALILLSITQLRQLQLLRTLSHWLLFGVQKYFFMLKQSWVVQLCRKK